MELKTADILKLLTKLQEEVMAKAPQSQIKSAEILKLLTQLKKRKMIDR
jgi:hypothetical protein